MTVLPLKPDGVPVYLTNLPRWVLWREAKRNGKATKAPLTPANRFASSTNPATWVDFNAVTDVWRRPETNSLFDGVGITLGDIGGGKHVCGVDFDSCLDEQGNLEPWAKPVVAALNITYMERSPGKTGIKAFFTATHADVQAVLSAFAIATGKWGSKRSVVGATNGQEHGPAIEVYLGPGRYFTVTGVQWPGSNDDLAQLDRDTLLDIAALADKVVAKQKYAGCARDTSRIAAAFRLAIDSRRAGATFEQMCEGIRTHPDTAEWCREKGDADDKRELWNIWRNTDKYAAPCVRVVVGKRHEAADAGLAALHRAGVQYYQRDQSLVRIARIKAKTSDGAQVSVPAVVPVATTMLGRALGQVSSWEKVNSKGVIIDTDPPKEVVEQIAAMTDDWPFPPLRGLIETPTLRPDGSLLQTPGYDPATGYFLFGPPPMAPIPEHPTRDDAEAALTLLNDDLLAEFPFKNEASRSVAMSMLLTPVLRAAMPVAPMHVVTAPEAGTGKSYLADIASAISTGDRCAVMAVSVRAEETEKRLIGAALAQFPIIALDNVSTLLWGDVLCQVTERAQLQLRPLGTSAVVRIANTFTVFANGNNIVIGDDAVRRCIQCNLDASMETPEERTFAVDPVRMILADRGKYIRACLIIARAYIAAGWPNKLPPRPSYEAWSDLVRSALGWLGRPDPVETIATIRKDDPIRQLRAAVFAAWEKELLVAVGYQTGELITQAEAWMQGKRARPDLFVALFAVAASREEQEIDPRRLGRWLSRNENTVVGRCKLTADRSDAARPRWKLIPA